MTIKELIRLFDDRTTELEILFRRQESYIKNAPRGPFFNAEHEQRRLIGIKDLYNFNLNLLRIFRPAKT
jgi:hypothetical protein